MKQNSAFSSNTFYLRLFLQDNMQYSIIFELHREQWIILKEWRHVETCDSLITLTPPPPWCDGAWTYFIRHAHSTHRTVLTLVNTFWGCVMDVKGGEDMWQLQTTATITAPSPNMYDTLLHIYKIKMSASHKIKMFTWHKITFRKH